MPLDRQSRAGQHSGLFGDVANSDWWWRRDVTRSVDVGVSQSDFQSRVGMHAKAWMVLERCIGSTHCRWERPEPDLIGFSPTWIPIWPSPSQVPKPDFVFLLSLRWSILLYICFLSEWIPECITKPWGFEWFIPTCLLLQIQKVIRADHI